MLPADVRSASKKRFDQSGAERFRAAPFFGARFVGFATGFFRGTAGSLAQRAAEVLRRVVSRSGEEKGQRVGTGRKGIRPQTHEGCGRGRLAFHEMGTRIVEPWV